MESTDRWPLKIYTKDKQCSEQSDGRGTKEAKTVREGIISKGCKESERRGPREPGKRIVWHHPSPL